MGGKSSPPPRNNGSIRQAGQVWLAQLEQEAASIKHQIEVEYPKRLEKRKNEIVSFCDAEIDALRQRQADLLESKESHQTRIKEEKEQIKKEVRENTDKAFDDQSVIKFWKEQEKLERAQLENELTAENTRLQNEAERLKTQWKDQMVELCRQFSFCSYQDGGNAALFLKNIENDEGQDMQKIKFAISDAETKSASLARTIEDNREAHKNLMKPVNNAIESANENLQKLQIENKEVLDQYPMDLKNLFKCLQAIEQSEGGARESKTVKQVLPASIARLSENLKAAVQHVNTLKLMKTADIDSEKVQKEIGLLIEKQYAAKKKDYQKQVIDDCFDEDQQEEEEFKAVIKIIKASFIGSSLNTHIKTFSDVERMTKKGAKLEEESLDILLDISENSITSALEIIKADLKSGAEQYAANSERIKAGLELFEPVSTQLNFLPDINLVVQQIVAESKAIQAETERMMIEGQADLHDGLQANQLALQDQAQAQPQADE